MCEVTCSFSLLFSSYHHLPTLLLPELDSFAIQFESNTAISYKKSEQALNSIQLKLFNIDFDQIVVLGNIPWGEAGTLAIKILQPYDNKEDWNFKLNLREQIP